MYCEDKLYEEVQAGRPTPSEKEVIDQIERLGANIEKLETTVQHLFDRVKPIVRLEIVDQEREDSEQANEMNTELSARLFHQNIRIHQARKKIENMLDGMEI